MITISLWATGISFSPSVSVYCQSGRRQIADASQTLFRVAVSIHWSLANLDVFYFKTLRTRKSSHSRCFCALPRITPTMHQCCPFFVEPWCVGRTSRRMPFLWEGNGPCVDRHFPVWGPAAISGGISGGRDCDIGRFTSSDLRATPSPRQLCISPTERKPGSPCNGRLQAFSRRNGTKEVQVWNCISSWIGRSWNGRENVGARPKPSPLVGPSTESVPTISRMGRKSGPR